MVQTIQRHHFNSYLPPHNFIVNPADRARCIAKPLQENGAIAPHEGNAIADLQRAYLMSNGGAVMKRDEALTALRGQRSLLETRFGVTIAT